MSPVTAEELAVYLALDLPLSADDEALLNSMLLAASQAYINFTDNELLQRSYTLKMDRREERQPGYTGLGLMPASLAWWTDFRIWPVDSITSVVDKDSDPIEYEADLFSKPARIEFDGLPNGIEIQYVAGYATAAEIPPGALEGIKQMAAFMYEHRGECNASEAAKMSGAKDLWRPDEMFLTL